MKRFRMGKAAGLMSLKPPGARPAASRLMPDVRAATARVAGGRLRRRHGRAGAAPSGQPVRGIQEVHQPFAFTALPGKIWHGRQSPLSVWMNRQL